MPRDTISVDAEGLTVTGEWGGPWTIKLDAIRIGGLTIPKFTTGWLAVQLASGVLAGIGGILFDVIGRALGLGGPSIQELLHQQLQAIAELVRNEIRADALRQDRARLRAIQNNMMEYWNAPTSSRDRLYEATTDSEYLLSDLESFGFETYMLTMIAGSLRLAILRERATFDFAERTNFAEMIRRLVSYHRQTEDLIDSSTVRRMPVLKALPPAGWSAPDRQVFGMGGRSWIYENYLPQPRETVGSPVLDVPLNDIPMYGQDDPRTYEEIIRRYNEAHIRGRAYLGEPYRRGHEVATDWATWLRVRKEIYREIAHQSEPVAFNVVDWDILRQKLRERTVIIGDEIVSKWLEAEV